MSSFLLTGQTKSQVSGKAEYKFFRIQLIPTHVVDGFADTLEPECRRAPHLLDRITDKLQGTFHPRRRLQGEHPELRTRLPLQETSLRQQVLGGNPDEWVPIRPSCGKEPLPGFSPKSQITDPNQGSGWKCRPQRLPDYRLYRSDHSGLEKSIAEARAGGQEPVCIFRPAGACGGRMTGRP